MIRADHDRHSFLLDIDDGSLSLRCVCGYESDDQSRPCWPRKASGYPVPRSDDCNYQSWVENLDATEILHGKVSLPATVAVKWDESDNMIVHLLGVYYQARPPQNDPRDQMLMKYRRSGGLA